MADNLQLCSIYKFTNKINNKVYIGSTIKAPNIRYNAHIYSAFHSNDHHYNYPLYQAIRKYGIENFSFEVIYQEYCNEEKIRQIEYGYIQKYNCVSPNGYNQTTNTLHPINDIEAYQKMKNTKREKSNRVAEFNNETKEIIKIWRSISDCSEEIGLTVNQISACCRGEHHSANNRYFCLIDDNNNLLIPEFKSGSPQIYKGKKGTTQHQKTNKKVAKIDMKTNQILAIYDSIALASRENNCDNSGISKTCRGTRAYCGGYKWKYIEEDT